LKPGHFCSRFKTNHTNYCNLKLIRVNVFKCFSSKNWQKIKKIWRVHVGWVVILLPLSPIKKDQVFPSTKLKLVWTCFFQVCSQIIWPKLLELQMKTSYLTPLAWLVYELCIFFFLNGQVLFLLAGIEWITLFNLSSLKKDCINFLKIFKLKLLPKQ
jgi:hypothetical protein